MSLTARPLVLVRAKPPAKPKLDPFIAMIDRILLDDKSRPRKQQHTAKRIFERLRDECGFTGGLTIVKVTSPAGVSGLKRCLCRWSIRRDMPRSTLAKPSASSAAWSARSTSSLLTCRTRTPASWSATPPRRRKPSATAMFGRSASLAAFRSPSFMTTPRSTWLVFLATGSGGRPRFRRVQSHYLFRDRFGRPGKGSNKGKVEGLVGYARRNFLVPLPVFESFEALNAYLADCCRRRMADRLRATTRRSPRDWSAILPRSRGPWRRLRRLRKGRDTSLVSVAGSLPAQRLLGPDDVRSSRRACSRVCR